MIQNHFLIFFLAAVTFGICEARDGRRNYNVNTNINSNMPGLLNGRPSREDVRNRDQYYSPPQDSFPEGPKLGELKNREKFYAVPRYPDRASGFEKVESGGPIVHDPEIGRYRNKYYPEEEFDVENSKPEYDIDGIRNDGSYGGDICEDGSYHPLIRNRLSNPFIDDQENRIQSYRRAWQDFPPIIVKPSYRRNDNWGYLNAPDGPVRQLHVQPAILPITKEAYVPIRPSTDRENPSYPNYSPPNYAPVVQIPTRRPSIVRKPRPVYPGQWQRPKAENQYDDGYMQSGGSTGDDYDNDGGYMEYGLRGGHGKANVNTNSNTNVNIMSRRMKPRSRRSVDRELKKSFVAPAKNATTNVVIVESSTSGGT